VDKQHKQGLCWSDTGSARLVSKRPLQLNMSKVRSTTEQTQLDTNSHIKRGSFVNAGRWKYFTV